MVINLTPEQETTLNEMAVNTGRPLEEIVEEALTDFLVQRKQLWADVDAAIRSIESGNFIDQEDMESRFQRRLGSTDK